jgi:UPF0271 protein|tara:strand:+ start:413 stop:1180 length:768 start_codon:yes stop_codon:yes gene_type:complete
MAKQVDINCDMGESFGMYKLGHDEEVIKYISSANIACGFHAGDPIWMNKTVTLAQNHGVEIGAHPSYPDLAGFGRRNMDISSDELKSDILYQIGALQAFTKDKKLQHVKPHGALYNQAVVNEKIAKTICEAILEYDSNLILLALSGSKWVKTAKEMGLKAYNEIFADRALNDDGSLVSRSKEGSVLHDVNEVADRSNQMVIEGIATTISGNEIEVEADSLCIHGDTPGAVQMAMNINNTLKSAGVEIIPLQNIAS